MLTSSASQYLHPDYLQPLPTTLDAKKSPLALLAQTCSSIGKDTTPSKPIIPPLEKKEGDKDSKSAPESQKRPASEERERDNDSKPGFRTIPPKEIPPLVPISNSSAGEKSGGSGSGGESSKCSSSASSSSGGSSLTSTVTTSAISRPMSATGSTSSSNGGHHSGPPRASSARGGGEDSRGSSGDHHESHRISSASPSRSKTSSLSIQSSPLMTTSTSSSSLTPSVLKHPAHHPSYLSAYSSVHPLSYPLPHLGLGLHVDPASPYPNPLAAHSGLSGLSAAAAAAAAQSSALKAAATGATTPLSPYVSYARVRTPSGATTLVPVCRDPFCTNCQLTVNNSHLSATCTAPGCAQCAHEKSLTSLTAGLGMGLNHLMPSLSQGVSLSSSASALSSFHSMYPHSAAALSTQVCNWVTPAGEYCGKRFATSDELLQHLRSHTSGVDATFAAAAGYGLGLPHSALSACHSHYPSGPLSPNTLRRTYPTSLSPVSGLLSHNRYHPYKSALTALPTPAVQGQAPYPGMSPYYPYGLYGPRLGAAAVP